MRCEGKNSKVLATAMQDRKLRSRLDDGKWTAAEVQLTLARIDANRWVKRVSITSPFSAAFSVPLEVEAVKEDANAPPQGDWFIVLFHFLFTCLLNGTQLGLMIWLFNTRWRVSG